MMPGRGSPSHRHARSHAAALLMGALLMASAAVTLARAQSPLPAPAEVAGLAGRHPADYYLKAGELLKGGRKDDAVFVFYLASCAIGHI